MFANYVPTVYKQHIVFDNQKKMDELVQKARLCYQQLKNKGECSKFWQNKDKSKLVIGEK